MIEIEKKFLVTSDGWRNHILTEEDIIQFYLSSPETAPTVRLRIKGDKGFLTLKYPSTSSSTLVRPEFEYEIPKEHVLEQRQFAIGNVIQKKRFEVEDEFGQMWDIDEFSSPRKGLILAEIELSSEYDEVAFPSWLGKEVSLDSRYSNQVMSYENYSGK